MKKIKSIEDLVPDAQNANKHSQRGMGLMQTSIEECGFGDSLTVDKNGHVISGNGRLETLADLQMSDAIVVQSDGTRPIVHQRTDLDLTKDAKAKRLSILQNRVGETNLSWNAPVLDELSVSGIDLSDLFGETELQALRDRDTSFLDGLLGDDLLDSGSPGSGGGGASSPSGPDSMVTLVLPLSTAARGAVVSHLNALKARYDLPTHGEALLRFLDETLGAKTKETKQKGEARSDV